MNRHFRWFWLVLGGVALVAVACGSSSKSPSATPTTVAASKVPGGTVTFAEGPQAAPNYIFPIANGQVFSVTNLSQFQALMYRPLYWFGNNNNSGIDYDYSLGEAPVWSNNDQTVTVTVKPWKWSDGETVTSRDVALFMNLLEANKMSYGAYVPGLFPDNVTSFTTPTPTTIVFNLNKSYNPDWFLYNELSQITPLPLAWDVTSASSPVPTTDTGSLPDTTTAGATAVFNYLNGLAMTTTTYATSPVWAVVDGPWKLSDFTNTGQATFVPNPTYSGSPKPTIDKFVELPFTSEQAELDVAKTGPANLTIGWLAAASVPQEPSLTALGYTAANAYTFSFNYFVLNLHNPTLGPVFSQLYFRQAFQHLVDQPGWIKAFYNNAAIPTYGVIPANPPNSFLSPAGKTNLYPFSVATASQLLSSHGWKVVPNGTTTCTDPGTGPTQCGAGVAAGTAITFNLDYQAGPVALDQEMKDLKSQASSVGITLNLTTHPFAQVIGAATQCVSTAADCSWTAENWGGGWVYSPDFYPSGEELFETHAVADYSNYSDPMADTLIANTTTVAESGAQQALDQYQDYMAQQLPVVFTPNAAGNPIPGGPSLVDNKLGGFSINAFSYITPETFYFTK